MKYEPKIGEYFYQYWKKPNGNQFWRVWQKVAEGHNAMVRDFQYYEKDKAVEFVRKMNGWNK